METMEGPMALLKKCKDEKLKLKVNKSSDRRTHTFASYVDYSQCVILAAR